jgi:outer membrane protein assembly factor BamB
MSWSLRRASLVLSAVAVLGSVSFLQHASGELRALQKEAPPPALPPKVTLRPSETDPYKDAFDFSGLTLPTDNELKKQIQAAVDYIHEEDWATATRTLQRLVERYQDVFVQLLRNGPDGKERLAWVSVKSEANRLIGKLPRKGMEFYKLTYGPPAAEMLKRAKENGDKASMGLVMARYFYTDAGAEATNWLGTYMLDRGDYAAAARYFERLLQRDGIDKLPPATLFKAAYAFHQAGDKAGEERVWKKLNDRVSDLKVGNETRSISDLEDHVKQLVRANYHGNASDWPVFGGAPGRNAQGIGGTAFMEYRWLAKTVSKDQADRHHNGDTTGVWVEKAEKRLHDRHQPVLTAFFPVTATTLTKDNQKRPLLIYRSYWGIHAVNVKSGKLEWETPSSWSLDRMLDKNAEARRIQAAHQWLTNYVDQNQRPQLVFENSTLGTLSTDNAFVYAVDDLAVPPPNFQTYDPRFGGNPYTPGLTFGPDVTDAIYHNRLQAFELASSGKLKWELGGRGGKDELSDSYFLGPPLPLGGKLYVMTEKQQELRLACIDPVQGKLVSLQTLATTKDKMVQNATRRTEAAHLAYGEGILVCPTNAGAVFGVDLLSNSLVWAYPYREKGEVPPPTTMQPNGRVVRGGIPPGWVMGPDGRLHPAASLNTHWKSSAPVVQDGKVVFTAPDAKSVHCLNLRDGLPLWSHQRTDDDLYLAGVFAGKVLLVGKKGCRALSLAKGEALWNLETGLPSGQGVASDNVYYLPLKEAARSKEPEICAIDVDKGLVLAHTKSRKKLVPGNLLFYEGDVLSQTSTEVAAFPQLKVKIAQMDDLIAKNPNDPAGLTERGDLRLDKGDLPGAIDDLRRALKSDPPPETQVKARTKLYDALTEYFQRDFNAAEEFLPEYEALCKVDLAGAGSDEDRAAREAEGRRRRGNFLCLVAKGREAQGRLVDAFEKYREFGEMAGKEELISVVDEPAVKAAPDVWSQGRIAAMVARANDEQRKPLEELITRKWAHLEESREPDLDELRNFVKVFGSLFDVGKEARLRLAERLMEVDEPSALLEAEQQLSLLRGPQEGPELAARAVEALGRLHTRKGLLEDAAYYYRLLGRQYARVVIREGKTGAELLNDLATDKRFLPYLDEPGRLGAAGKIKVTEERGSFPFQNQTYYFARAGEALPFFDRNRVALRLDYHQFKLIDRATGEERWGKNLTRTMFQNIVYSQPSAPKFSFQNLGHLVVLPVGHMVFGIDPVHQRVLWEKNLAGPGAGMPNYQLTLDPRDGSPQIIFSDGWIQRLGQTGPLEGAVICLQTRDALLAVDPLTGRTLWTRSDVNSRSHLFGDDQNLYVVEMGADAVPSSTRVFRAYDGVSVKAPDFAKAYEKRVRLVGRNILLSETDARNVVTLRLYDVLTGQDLWKQTYAPGAVVLHAEDANLAGVVEPDGTVLVVDLRTQKGVLNSKMDPKYLDKVQAVHLLSDGRYFYVACNGPVDPNIMPFGGVRFNLQPGAGLRALPVNGEVYSFHRATGKMNWHVPVPNQMLVLDQFEDLPMVLFTANYQKWVINAAGRNVMQVSAVKSVEKRTGKLIYDNESMPNGMNFHALHVDARAGRIDFIGQFLKITYSLDGGPGPGKAEPPSAPPGAGAPPPVGFKRGGLGPQGAGIPAPRELPR